jgi:hypothetical protein
MINEASWIWRNGTDMERNEIIGWLFVCIVVKDGVMVIYELQPDAALFINKKKQSI